MVLLLADIPFNAANTLHACQENCYNIHKLKSGPHELMLN